MARSRFIGGVIITRSGSSPATARVSNAVTWPCEKTWYGFG
ncbi:hypothetical protein ACFCX0_16920 [Streptomyces sp. NPDC056352]